MRSLVVSQDCFDLANTRLRGIVRALMDGSGPEISTFADAENRIFQVEPEVVFVVLSADPEAALELLPRLRRGNSFFLLAVGSATEPQLILRAMQCGADQYLDENNLEESLKAALSRFHVEQEAPASPTGRLAAFLSTSGGSGASTLAVNVASILAREHERCALVDLNPGRGDLAALLDLKPPFNLSDVCLNAGRMDRGMFEKVLARHASGIYLLAAPQEFADARVVTPRGVTVAVGFARTMFPGVVVDLEDCFHEEQAVVLRQASTVFLVCRLDFTSLRQARRVIKHVLKLGVPRPSVRIVVNRYGQPNELPVDEAEDALGERLSLFVPDDPKTFNVANNIGLPAVLKNPQARVSQSIEQLADVVMDRPQNRSGLRAGAAKLMSLFSRGR
jgi:pilus assembly protein CpaE